MSFSRRDLLRGLVGSAVVAGCSPAASDSPADDTDLATPDVVLEKTPWVSLTGPTSARLRFETLVDVEVPVWITTPNGPERRVPTRTTAQLTYENTPLIGNATPDVVGLHVLHDLVMEDLTPGEVTAWRVPTLAEAHEGAFRAAPGPDSTVRLGWMADTMWPQTDSTVAALVAQAPDVFLHGGDMQYEANPSDTWQAFFRSLVPLTSTAPFHAAVGNHEIEKEGELEQMYDRLFSGQGFASLERAHAFRVGSALVLLLDSETYRFGDDTQEQYEWLDTQLNAADADDTVKVVILGWHRPLYTFTDYYDGGSEAQDAMLPRLTAHPKVRLVLNGHAHSFEHFRFSGIDWVVEGTAGALLYDLNAALPLAQSQRPDLVEARLHAEQEFGCSTIDIAVDGTLTVRRIQAITGAETYRFDVPASA